MDGRKLIGGRKPSIGRAGMIALWVVAALSVEACLSFQTYCEEKIDCEDGNEADVDACVVAEDTAEDRASLYGCTEEFETAVECREEDAKCTQDVYGVFDNDCDDEGRELSSCMGDSLPF